MMVKNLTAYTDWAIYHSDRGATRAQDFTSGDFTHQDQSIWQYSAPATTYFTVGNSNRVNDTGSNYVAYLFADNVAEFGEDSDEPIVKCGGYSGSGSTEQLINCGFEPQWLLIKSTSSGENWRLFTALDGFRAVGEGDSSALTVNTNATQGAVGKIHVDPRGFRFRNEGTGSVNASGSSYIYVAIRRSNRVPDTPQHVFYSDYKRGTGGYAPRFAGCLPEPDFCLYKENQNNTDFQMSNRFLSNGRFIPVSHSSGRQSDTGRYEWRRQGGFGTSGNADGTRLAWMFRRANKFCDMVHWYGNGSAQSIYHNLGAVPRMVWVLPSTPLPCSVYNFHSGANSYMHIKNGSADSPQSSSSFWNGQDPTENILYLGSSSDVNANNTPYHAYLFGDCPGISKIDTYTGSTDSVTVDCGFQPRAIWIKNLSSSAHWWFCNTQTGINPGNDNAFMFSDTSASTTSYNIVNLTSTGFVVQNTNNDWNGNGNTYLYMAIAA